MSVSASPFETRTVAAGRGGSGEVAGRAVLVVPFDGMWELHDKEWDDSTEDECQESYWPDGAKSANQFVAWAIEWVDRSELREFINEHWPEFADRGFEALTWEASFS